MKRKLDSKNAEFHEPKRIRLGDQIDVCNSAEALKQMSSTLSNLLEGDNMANFLDLSDNMPHKTKEALQPIQIHFATKEVPEVKSYFPEVMGNAIYLGDEALLTGIVEQVRNDKSSCQKMAESKNLRIENVPEKYLIQIIKGKELKTSSENGKDEELSSYGDLIKNWSTNSDRVESYVAMEDSKSIHYDHNMLTTLCLIGTMESIFYFNWITKLLVCLSFASLTFRETITNRFREIGEYPLLLVCLTFLFTPMFHIYFVQRVLYDPSLYYIQILFAIFIIGTHAYSSFKEIRTCIFVIFAIYFWSFFYPLIWVIKQKDVYRYDEHFFMACLTFAIGALEACSRWLFGSSIFSFLATLIFKWCSRIFSFIYQKAKAHKKYWLYLFMLSATLVYDFGNTIYDKRLFRDHDEFAGIIYFLVLLSCFSATIVYYFDVSLVTLFYWRIFATPAFQIFLYYLRHGQVWPRQWQ